MPWSGGAFTRTNGVNTGATLWAQDRDDGTKILATRHDTNDQDMANGINSTLEKSGSNAATGNLNIGSNRLTAVADGTAKTDAATVNQIQSNAPAFQATDTGTANAHVIALSPAITAYAAGQRITFKSGAASTGASTLNVNTLGVKALKKLHDQDIASGDIESGSIVTAVYDGTNFQVTSQLASEAADAGAAYAGVLQANANFVDQVIFGPSVDGVPWNGAWSKASVYSSLMLATIEDEGANTEINIWDLTEESAGVISTTPLATVDLANAATPTSIAAAMGYLIVGSEDGIAILDPHSGAWAERTVGWPRTLSTSTTPALTNNDVSDVAAGFSDQPGHDPLTGGPMPTFGVSYGTGADIVSIIKDNGTVLDKAGTVGNPGVAISQGRLLLNVDAGGDAIYQSNNMISAITADDFGSAEIMRDTTFPYGLGADGGFTSNGDLVVAKDATGLTYVNVLQGTPLGSMTAAINRTYNTGYMVGDIRGAWLANSVTVDRSYKANTLTATGSITEAAVESGAELLGYSGFSGSIYLARTATDADYNALGNGPAYISIWFKSSGNSGNEDLITIGTSSSNPELLIRLTPSGFIEGIDRGATSLIQITGTQTYDNGLWHKVDFYRVSNVERYLYVDSVLIGSSTADAGSLTDSSMRAAVGSNSNLGTQPSASSVLALAKLSVTVPTDTQLRQMYDAEKGMFVASAECLLQSGSTDAVIDVDVDPLSGKVIVTQTDAITVFDGLVVDSKPTVNSGNSEKGKLWGALRAEQNSANAYVTAPATDQRQVNEMVRGLASDLPAAVDLSKAKGLLVQNSSSSTAAIGMSYNIKSVTRTGTGTYLVTLAIPFKSKDYVVLTSGTNYAIVIAYYPTQTPNTVVITTEHDDSTLYDSAFSLAFFGELENE
jgi:hypothetical protein